MSLGYVTSGQFLEQKKNKVGRMKEKAQMPPASVVKGKEKGVVSWLAILIVHLNSYLNKIGMMLSKKQFKM